MPGVLACARRAGGRGLHCIDWHESAEYQRREGRHTDPFRHHILRTKAERSLTSAGIKNRPAEGEPVSIRPAVHLTNGGDGANASGGANGRDDAIPNALPW
jgi:hypothetical protein